MYRKFYILLSVICLFTINTNASFLSDDLVGEWNFDNSSDLTAATVGKDLKLVGKHQKVAGINHADGAVRIGLGSYYKCTHGIAANGGGKRVNEYTLVFDISFPKSSDNKWKAIFQASSSNSDDAECFFRGGGAVDDSIGLSSTGYSSWSLAPETWVRLVIVVDNGTSYKIYANGKRVLNGSAPKIDSKFSLDLSSILFFADNSKEDNTIDLSAIKIYKRPLNDIEVRTLGGIENDKNNAEQKALKLDNDTIWRCYDKSTTPEINWSLPDYDDSSWAPGKGFWRAILKDNKHQRTAYFRHTFTLDNPIKNDIWLQTFISAGAIFYVNGQKAFQFNMNENPALAKGKPAHQGNLHIRLKKEFFKVGKNSITVQVHSFPPDNNLSFFIKSSAKNKTLSSKKF